MIELEVPSVLRLSMLPEEGRPHLVSQYAAPRVGWCSVHAVSASVHPADTRCAASVHSRCLREEGGTEMLLTAPGYLESSGGRVTPVQTLVDDEVDLAKWPRVTEWHRCQRRTK